MTLRQDHGWYYALYRFSLVRSEPFRILLSIGIIIGLFVLYLMDELSNAFSSHERTAQRKVCY